MAEAASERTVDGRGSGQFGDNLMHAGSLTASRILRPNNASVLWRRRQISPTRARARATERQIFLRRRIESRPIARLSKLSPARPAAHGKERVLKGQRSLCRADDQFEAFSPRRRLARRPEARSTREPPPSDARRPSCAKQIRRYAGRG
jgi:hypothetical protein